MGLQTKEKEIAVERQLQMELFAIKEAAFKAEYNVEKTVEGRKKITDELFRLEKEHKLKLNQLELQSIKYRANLYREYFGAITSGFKTSVMGLVQGTMTFTQAINNIFASAIDSIISLFVDKLLQAILGSFLEATIGSSVSTNAQIMAGARLAFVNALASFSANPLTVAIAPELAAGYEALAYTRLSAKGGWDNVPFDGAVTSLHKGEMVLPQNLAEKVRSMTEPSQNITYNITAMDAQSFKSFASKNKSILFNTHNSALRDGLQYGVRGV
jgi:hypothetical protein